MRSACSKASTGIVSVGLFDDVLTPTAQYGSAPATDT